MGKSENCWFAPITHDLQSALSATLQILFVLIIQLYVIAMFYLVEDRLLLSFLSNEDSSCRNILREGSNKEGSSLSNRVGGHISRLLLSQQHVLSDKYPKPTGFVLNRTTADSNEGNRSCILTKRIGARRR